MASTKPRVASDDAGASKIASDDADAPTGDTLVDYYRDITQVCPITRRAYTVGTRPPERGPCVMLEIYGLYMLDSDAVTPYDHPFMHVVRMYHHSDDDGNVDASRTVNEGRVKFMQIRAWDPLRLYQRMRRRMPFALGYKWVHMTMMNVDRLIDEFAIGQRYDGDMAFIGWARGEEPRQFICGVYTLDDCNYYAGKWQLATAEPNAALIASLERTVRAYIASHPPDGVSETLYYDLYSAKHTRRLSRAHLSSIIGETHVAVDRPGQRTWSRRRC